jgi:asparagine synthase (glutamine-hydrolysing)
MCGINGIYDVKGLENPRGLVETMNRATIHRGPDFSDVYIDEQVAFGHNRLAIIDLNPQGNQPMQSADGNVVVVFNGEIYNYKDLRNELIDYPFKSNSDTEVILAAYQKWGIDCLKRFNGMFAIALWDKTLRTFYLIRDRMGIKPVYYFDNNVHFAFSSEMRGLLTLPFVNKKLSNQGLRDYVQYGTVHAPYTLLDEVKMLMPGQYIVITDEGKEEHFYWDIHTRFSRKSDGQNYEEVKNEVRNLFVQAVQRRLVADVPFGAFLSGGIDSSAVVAAMAQSGANDIKTFSIIFDEEEFSEARYARLVAEKYGTQHTEIKLTSSDFLSSLPEAVSALDHPSVDGLNSYIVSRATKAGGVTMALSGLGGDELFAGYDIFKRSYALLGKKWIISFPIFTRKWAGNILRIVRPSVASDKIAKTLLVKYMELPFFYPINRQIYSDEVVQRVLSTNGETVNAVHQLVEEGVGIGTVGFNAPFMSKVSYAEWSTYMQNVLLRDTDQMSMAHALEVRVPFLDHQLVEYVYGVNDAFKFPYTPKKLLVDALGDWLPDEIVNRPKMGFVFPWEQWMLGDLKSYCEEGLKILSATKLIDSGFIQRQWGDFERGGKTKWSHVWHLVVLGHWLRTNGINSDLQPE